jgi:hypothetical protein
VISVSPQEPGIFGRRRCSRPVWAGKSPCAGTDPPVTAVTAGFEPATTDLTSQCSDHTELRRHPGSPGRIRTFNLVVNGHLLCRVELRGNELPQIVRGPIYYQYMQLARLICGQCGASFTRQASMVKHALNRGQEVHYCSRECMGLAKRREKIISAICRGCGTQFSRPTNGSHDQGLFCSRTCSARHLGAQRTDVPKKTCPQCGGPKSYLGAICRACRINEFRLQTLGELRQNFGTHSFHSKVRSAARGAYIGPLSCAACGYGLHVEICHIRDVASFPDSAILAEVNSPGNLIALDRRCHWEFDHGYLVRIDGKFVAGKGFEPLACGL